MKEIDQLADQLASHYTHFNVANRLLFTGHSHQAWPDVALEGLQESFICAASEVDNKWEHAFEKTNVLRTYLRNFYDDPDGYYCLGENTHLLLTAWLSSFDLKQKPKVITTNSEFYSMSRQLRRLREEGLKVEMMDAESAHIVDEIADTIDDHTCAIMISRVFFESSLINQHLQEIAGLARTNGIPLLIDDYHGTNVAPISLRDANLENCYLLIGGYKYLQWGEGNCFLRFPKDCTLRPAITGWFASFNTLDEPHHHEQPVSYDKSEQRFATGTYDPASQFRAAKVVEFFDKQGLTPGILRNQYQQQVGLLRKLFQDQGFDPEIIALRHHCPLDENGGFLALRSPYARIISARLLERGVFTDARGEILRLGPAPYITSSQINRCIILLSGVIQSIQ